ncbi:hypothetical protein GF325_03960 [Candidatus Bathyarchaeota archaeon]|nr:hypothetical protein [Candidatus Bathyarchaeota archaeon]
MAIHEMVHQAARRDFLAGVDRVLSEREIDPFLSDRCLELALRYSFAHVGSSLDEKIPQVTGAIIEIAKNELHRIASCSMHHHPRDQVSSSYWVERISSALEIQGWLDDSLHKWYLDKAHPLADIILHTCRKHVMSSLVGDTLHGSRTTRTDLEEAIIPVLLEKLPFLARFRKHLPRALEIMIEADILGMPLSKLSDISGFGGNQENTNTNAMSIMGSDAITSHSGPHNPATHGLKPGQVSGESSILSNTDVAE